MLDWLVVYLVVFFFVFLFQAMISFFDGPKEKKEGNGQTEERGKR